MQNPKIPTVLHDMGWMFVRPSDVENSARGLIVWHKLAPVAEPETNNPTPDQTHIADATKDSMKMGIDSTTIELDNAPEAGKSDVLQPTTARPYEQYITYFSGEGYSIQVFELAKYLEYYRTLGLREWLQERIHELWVWIQERIHAFTHPVVFVIRISKTDEKFQTFFESLESLTDRITSGVALAVVFADKEDGNGKGQIRWTTSDPPIISVFHAGRWVYHSGKVGIFPSVECLEDAYRFIPGHGLCRILKKETESRREALCDTLTAIHSAPIAWRQGDRWLIGYPASVWAQIPADGQAHMWSVANRCPDPLITKKDRDTILRLLTIAQDYDQKARENAEKLSLLIAEGTASHPDAEFSVLLETDEEIQGARVLEDKGRGQIVRRGQTHYFEPSQQSQHGGGIFGDSGGTSWQPSRGRIFDSSR